jgi:hypothetical protein
LTFFPSLGGAPFHASGRTAIFSQRAYQRSFQILPRQSHQLGLNIQSE